MAFDFPAAPTEGQTYAPPGGPTYIFHSPVWQMVPQSPIAYVATAEAKNRIVNGAFQISQEFGNTLLGPTGVLATYAADQWLGGSNTTGTVSQQRVQVPTPKGSVNRLRMTIVTVDASLTTNEHLSIVQTIEGIRVADFLYGTAQAKQAVLRFGFKGPAGTYAASLRNNASDRSYIANFIIAAGQANTDTEQVLVIPGDTVGTWLTDSGIGIWLRICLGTGPTWQGVAGWQAGNLFNIAGNSNGLAVAGAVYELFDVGLYLDPNNTGVPPAWQMPDEAEELRSCQRYYQTAYNWLSGSVTLNLGYLMTAAVPVMPRGGLQNAMISPANQGSSQFPATPGTVSAMQYANGVIREQRTANATHGSGFFQTLFTINARM
jgi:hypothetical protein